MLSVDDLADYTIRYSTSIDCPISNLQLQKILYFLQSVYCRKSGGKLLFPECFQAWPYGPVIREVYEKYSIYGGRTITDHGEIKLDVDADTREFINAGIAVLGNRSPWDLVKTTHAPGSPWDRVYQNGAGYKQEIPNEYIIEASMRKKAQAC